jgi:1-deoxy-D-xylulose-5-phosphate reductoisomerase
MNAANEIAVALFLDGKISFLQIADKVESCMNKMAFIQQPNLEDLLYSDKEARRVVVGG